MRDKSIELLTVWGHFLSAVDSDKRNVFHQACLKGSLDLLEYMLKIAGPDQLDILPLVINEKDEMFLPPLFLLCQRGYNKKFNKDEQRITQFRLKMI